MLVTNTSLNIYFNSLLNVPRLKRQTKISLNPRKIFTQKEPAISANEVTCDEEDNHISYHADKSDCTMYYMCEGERKHHMPCPVNLVFNPNENVCDWPENVEGCLQHTQAPPV